MKCEDADKACPVHKGVATCTNAANACLQRVDMEDSTGTLMCGPCADDALQSGLFRSDVKLWIQATTRRS